MGAKEGVGEKTDKYMGVVEGRGVFSRLGIL